MLYNIKLNVNSYLHYLKYCEKNIITNKFVAKNMYFNGIIKNHIIKFNEDEKKKYKLTVFDTVYVFTDFNINGVCKIEQEYFYPNAYVLAESKSKFHKKWNIFPAVLDIYEKFECDLKNFEKEHQIFKQCEMPYIITEKYIQNQYYKNSLTNDRKK